jgi:hypothetical protein
VHIVELNPKNLNQKIPRARLSLSLTSCLILPTHTRSSHLAPARAAAAPPRAAASHAATATGPRLRRATAIGLRHRDRASPLPRLARSAPTRPGRAATATGVFFCFVLSASLFTIICLSWRFGVLEFQSYMLYQVLNLDLISFEQIMQGIRAVMSN